MSTANLAKETAVHLLDTTREISRNGWTQACNNIWTQWGKLHTCFKIQKNSHTGCKDLQIRRHMRPNKSVYPVAKPDLFCKDRGTHGNNRTLQMPIIQNLCITEIQYKLQKLAKVTPQSYIIQEDLQ